MDESKAIEQVAAAYEKLTRQSGRIQALEKKLSEGTITMKEGAELNDLRAKAFGRALSGSVPGIERGSREGACVSLLKDRCGDVDELALAAQKTALTRQGLNITPLTAPFEEDRARKIGRSLEDETVPDETIQRRARSATETMLRSQYDRDMKKGAETCASAGLRTYIVRDADPGCCKWCSEAAGRYTYGEEPKDVYRRHDNCTCTVTYESGRGRQNVWSKQNWSQEQEKEYLRLRDEMAPKRLNARQAQALREQVGGLTFGGKSATMYYDHITDFTGADKLPPVTLNELEKVLSVIPDSFQKELSGFISRIHIGQENETSGYSPKNHDIRLNPITGTKSFVHELGHAFGDMRKLYDDPEFLNILTDGLDLSNGHGIETFLYNDTIVGIIRSPKFVNPQQGRVYADFAKIDYSKPVPPVLMQEYISEGFDAFFNRPEDLKSKDPKLYSYLERSIYGKISE